MNHKQTYRQETDGGYIWSPKSNANGARNVTYDNLTRCQRGDVVFSYANGRISQLGLVEAAAVTEKKPEEFGSTGENWNPEGWLVRVNWQPLLQALVPQTFFELLLSPHVDKLFDRHWISFDSGGELIWQHEAAGEALRCWGIEGANLIRPFSREQEAFLSAHRDALRH